MSKVCIVCAGAIRNMVMVYMYTDFLNKINQPYDIIYMDKYHEVELTDAQNSFRIEYDGVTKKGKIKGYFTFIKESTKILKENNYDFVIVWGELTAVLLLKVLTTNYINKYCINIRDLFVGRRKILNLLLNYSIKFANYVTVSSPKYLEVLPKKYANYFFIHSYNKKIMDEVSEVKRELKNDKIRILYIGNIRFLEHLYKLIDEVKNDSRFQLTVAGFGSDTIKTYLDKNRIDNVEVYGTFPKEETSYFLSKADVIYNLYGTTDVNLRFALSNKLYYAVCLNLPILVYKETYMYELSSKCGIGFAFDLYTKGKFANGFYSWYQELDKERIKLKCNELLEDAVISQNRVLDYLYEQIKQ